MNTLIINIILILFAGSPLGHNIDFDGLSCTKTRGTELVDGLERDGDIYNRVAIADPLLFDLNSVVVPREKVRRYLQEVLSDNQ